MAVGLPTPKSREQLLSDMLTEYVGLTGINDLNTGSAMTQFFDVVARSVARTSGDIFQILRDYSVERATGEALNRIGDEERVKRRTAQVSGGVVKVIDSSFNKIATKIYSGAAAPNIGSIIIRVSDASLFPTIGAGPIFGHIYIGRGTPNIEGPLDYTAVVQVGAFWEITLVAPTSKFHNISESVILGQGGTRNIPVGSTVAAPGTGATADVNYNVSSATILLDGENENNAVQVVAQEPGSLGNAPVGTIRTFTTPPFASATVINNVPFTTGADSESDDDYRDRIKKERLSRGLGTALAVKNAVLGAQAPDENARVTSNEIDTSNVEQTVLYIDNGQGYEEKSEGVGIEFVVDQAIGGEQNFQLTTGGNQTSVAKAFVESSESTPFIIYKLDRLAILVGGIVSEHIFPEGAFQAEGAATAYEIVASINNDSDLTYEATTAESGTKVVIRAKAENDEFLQLTSPSAGTDAGPNIGFPSNEVATVLLYKNRELLNKNGRSAFVITKEKFNWSPSITDSDTLTISIDGTAEITYLILDTDFLSEGQHSTVSSQNSLSSWVNVINNKVTGATAEINGEQLKLTSNLGPSNRAGIAINPTSSLVSKGMFSPDLGLTASGNEADFEISRNTSQIKLNTPLKAGDSLNLGSEFTRAEIESSNILGGQTTLSSTGYVWILVDDVDATPVTVGITAETFLNVTTPGGDIVRYTSTSLTAFLNIQVGDYAIIWSDELSDGNRLEGRVSAVTATTLDLKVTNGEVSAAVLEGPILFGEGFTVIRSKQTPQKLKIDTGVYNINTVASIFNEQLDNATVSVSDDEIFVFRTNTEDLDGGIFIVDFNDPSKALNLIKNSQSQSINSQVAFYETGFADRHFPEFVHGSVNTEQFADPPNNFINTVDSSQNLDALGLDPSGLLCFKQPYGNIDDVYSTECVDIQDYLGSVVNVEDSYFFRRSRVNDRFQVLNGYDFGHEDSLVAVLDNDPTGKTFDMSLFRTAVTNITLTSNANNFRAYDQEGGATTEFTEFFGNTFAFDNYKALMQAKNVIDPINGALTPEDAILYRSVEWGRSGEKVGIGYQYPTTANQGLSHIVSTSTLINIKIFLKSGDARVTTADGTTEWNVSITPAVGHELVTYTHTGTGTAPGLGTIIAGDYVSVITTGEFDPANIGAFKVDSSTVTSFTVKRATGDAVAESDIANLEVGTVAFFQSEDTTAQEIVDYVGLNITDYITATIVDDAGLTGAGIITDSTEQDLSFAAEYIYLLDGKNYILSSDLDAVAFPIAMPHFTFKTSLSLPTFDTITIEAYSFNNGEAIKIVPTTSLHVTEFLNTLAVTGYTTLGEIKSVDRNTNLQLSTNILGTNGGVQISGGTASAAAAAVEGSASSLGEQSDLKSLITIISATSSGFHSDQWVKLFATEAQKKTASINALNSIEISESFPSVGNSKIEIFDKSTEQRLFGRNRYHTRTRGRTFKVEDAGEFVCISWDEIIPEPFFIKSAINVKDSASSTLTFLTDSIRGTVNINVDTGLMRFDEINLGDLITIQNRTNSENNGSFLVTGISPDAKTLKISNQDGVDELVNGTFTVTDNVAVLLSAFTVGANVLTEGTEFIAGVDINETASNLAAAISLLLNLTATSLLGVVTVNSEVANVTIATSVAGGGATADQAQLIAPISNTGDLTAQSEVQEGDSVIIGSDFNILNQGTFRVIRRFNNSIYIDNSNAIEEEVTLTSQLISFSASFATFDALVAGVASNVQLSADITGIAGDSILLTGDGVKDLNTLVLEWNTANGSNTVTLNSANGTSVPNNLEAMQLAGGDGATGYDIDKIDGLNRLKWNGAGTEPVLEDMRPGDIVTLGTDFNALNRGSYHIIDAGTKLQEITRMTMAREIDMTSGQYATLFSAEDVTDYYMWFNIAAGGGDPGVTANPMEIAVATLDSAAQVAVKVADEINLTYSADFTAVADGDDVIITTVGYGETTNAANGNIAGTFSLIIEQDGRRNFANYINVNGITETGIVIADVLEFHKEAIQFKEYEGTIIGDTFKITSNFLGADNVGNFVITDVLSESEIIVNNALVGVDRILLDTNFNKIFVQEEKAYVGYKKIEYIAANPANLNNKNIIFDSENQFAKINEIAGVSMSAVGKMSFPSAIIRGVDSYKYNTGLIAESNRIVYGDPRDSTTYPGVGAAGAEIFIKAPLVRRIQVSINVRIKTGVPFTTIVEEVRNSVGALINSNPVGQPISISNIVSRVDVIGGIQAVAISSPQYDALNDVIKVNAGEKTLVLDIISDILVSKID